MTLVTKSAALHTIVINRGPFHMRTSLPLQRSTLLKFYFAASYVVLIEELVRASLS
ncbi:MAG: transcriptional regulator [Stenotrophomonas indicatrix]|nr:transcriptional regulator [Stenotrophomonas sp. MYb57]MDF2483151.1 transcriptional regulator [Stenotrophomonas indicatrix]OJH80381.1 MAG: transcriptional regulator [Stenotrophomonas maltophilia]PII12465.1 transcriptional regulator [Stenotrophomonas indicatrix]PII16532.1 transcriptional regulator [Stenotrophomonas indicatrix]